MRIDVDQVVQDVEGNVVIVDESTGQEIIIKQDKLSALRTAIDYFSGESRALRNELAHSLSVVDTVGREQVYFRLAERLVNQSNDAVAHKIFKDLSS